MPRYKLATLTTTQKVLKSTFYNFLANIIGRIGGLIFTIIVARTLYPEFFGIYSLTLTVVLTVATFTDLGINATLIRYLSESLKKKTKETETEARSRLYFLLNFKIVLTAVIAIALFLLAESIAVHIFKKPLLALPFQIGSIYLFTISIQGFFSSIFYALQKIQYSTISEIIFQVLRIILIIFLLNIHKNVGTVFITLTIALFISFLFLYSILFKNYVFLIKGEIIKLEKQERKRLLSFFGWLTISSISLVFFVHVDTFMLGIFLPSEFVGFYHSIFSIVGAVAAFVSFGSVLLPVFTQLEQGKLERGFKKVFRYVSLISVPAAIGLAYIIVPAIQIIYGHAYVPASYKFSITIASALLSLLIIETSFTAIYSALFQAKEKPKIPSLLIVVATIFNIILNYAFIRISIAIAPEYGLIGVALATFISRYFNLIMMAILAKTKLNIKASVSSTIKPFIASLVMLGFMFVFDYFVAMSIFTGILMITIAVAIYFFIMFLMKGIMKEDFEMRFLRNN